MQHVLGGKVEKAPKYSEYGKTEVLIDKTDSTLFESVSEDKTICWMSHFRLYFTR